MTGAALGSFPGPVGASISRFDEGAFGRKI
jgi:hypothetical protein